MLFKWTKSDMQDTSSMQELLKTGESQTVEFKTSFVRETIETLVAFVFKPRPKAFCFKISVHPLLSAFRGF